MPTLVLSQLGLAWQAASHLPAHRTIRKTSVATIETPCNETETPPQ